MEIQDLPDFELPVDWGSCLDAKIQVFPDFGLPVDRVSCPDTEIRVLPDFGLPVDRVSCPETEIRAFFTISVSGCRFGRKKILANSTSTHSNCTMNST
jgi:hypothetical protein